MSRPRWRPELCTVEGCGKPHRSKGFCSAHYTRNYRHGDPLGGNGRYGYVQEFLTKHTTYASDECLWWPYAKDHNGYGVAWFRHRQTTANYIMCTLAHGEPPSPQHESAHSCGNGHLGCVNPKHLRWTTRSENHADKIIHDTHTRGERSSSAKLTETQVHRIRAARGKIGQRFLAAEYGVSKSTICSIQLGKNWGWMPRKVAA